MLMFLQKMISRIIYPFNFSLLLLLIGLWLLNGGRRRLIGKWLVSLAVALFLLSSYWPVAAWLAGTLENRYQPMTVPEAEMMQNSPALKVPRRILVLNGGMTFDDAYAPSSQLGAATMIRIAEGIRLHQAIPESFLYVTAPVSPHNQAALNQVLQYLEEQGVDRNRAAILAGGLNTGQEARIAAKRMGTRPFLLVTSALHMPRAMLLFEGKGMQPVAAPVDFNSLSRTVSSIDIYMPTLHAAQLTEQAFHEYVGMLWASLTE